MEIWIGKRKMKQYTFYEYSFNPHNNPMSPLDCKEIQSVHPKGNQSRIFIGRIDAEAETPILWPPD